jgi:hypothetical protein
VHVFACAADCLISTGLRLFLIRDVLFKKHVRWAESFDEVLAFGEGFGVSLAKLVNSSSSKHEIETSSQVSGTILLDSIIFKFYFVW